MSNQPAPAPQWRTIPIPDRKTEYEGKYLRLFEDPPRYEDYRPTSAVYASSRRPNLKGKVVYLARRMNARDTQCSADDCSWLGSIRFWL